MESGWARGEEAVRGLRAGIRVQGSEPKDKVQWGA